MSRRSERRAAELARHQATLDAIAGLKERVEQAESTQRQHPELDNQQRREMAIRWQHEVCSWCGGLHQGLCHRVEHIRINQYGLPEEVWFWPEGQWHPDESTLWSEDVWEDPATMAKDLEDVRREAQGTDAARKLIADQQKRSEAVADRHRSPREKLKEIVGGADQS